MSLRRVAAAPFLRREAREATRAEFIYSLTRDLEWFDTDEAEELLRAGIEEGLIETDGDEVRPEFDPSSVDVPKGYSPSAESVLSSVERGAEDDTGTDVFERAVERLVGSGYEKREAVAEINRIHAEMGEVRVEAAALVAAKREGLLVSDLAEEGLEGLRGS